MKARIKEGKLDFGSDRANIDWQKFKDAHEGELMEIKPYFPESKKQRGWFEGAMVRTLTYFHEELDYRKSSDCKIMHEWLKQEFNGEAVTVNGKTHIRGKSSKGLLNKEFGERVLNYYIDQGYPIEAINHERYKDWKNRLSITEKWNSYIDYLVDLKILPSKI